MRLAGSVFDISFLSNCFEFSAAPGSGLSALKGLSQELPPQMPTGPGRQQAYLSRDELWSGDGGEAVGATTV